MNRFIAEYGLPEYDANLLTQSRGLADYFEATARAAASPKAASNWIMGELLRTLKERNQSIEQVAVSPQALADLVRIVDRGTISSTVAKDVFATMYETGRSADEIVRTEGLAQIGDEDALTAIVREAIAANPDAVEQVRKGRNNAFGFLVGHVMKASKGKANPKVVNELLKRELSTQ
jgi:aspartyl-tRNA(Asn)/glutamyl-tRNA(Gln) amidotransferase subunit B